MGGSIGNLTYGQILVAALGIALYGTGALVMFMSQISRILDGKAGRWGKDGALSVVYVLAALVWPLVLLGAFINKYFLREGYTCCGINYDSCCRGKAHDEEQAVNNKPQNQQPINSQPSAFETEFQDIPLSPAPPPYRPSRVGN